MIETKIKGDMEGFTISGDFNEQLEEHIMKGLDRYMLQVVVADAKKNSSVREVNGGTLRRSWQSTPARRTLEGIEAELVNNTEYALHYEFGHRHRAGEYRGKSKKGNKRYLKKGFYVKGRYTGTNAIDRGKRGIAGMVNEAFKKVFGR